MSNLGKGNNTKDFESINEAIEQERKEAAGAGGGASVPPPLPPATTTSQKLYLGDLPPITAEQIEPAFVMLKGKYLKGETPPELKVDRRVAARLLTDDELVKHFLKEKGLNWYKAMVEKYNYQAIPKIQKIIRTEEEKEMNARKTRQPAIDIADVPAAAKRLREALLRKESFTPVKMDLRVGQALLNDKEFMETMRNRYNTDFDEWMQQFKPVEAWAEMNVVTREGEGEEEERKKQILLKELSIPTLSCSVMELNARAGVLLAAQGISDTCASYLHDIRSVYLTEEEQIEFADALENFDYFSGDTNGLMVTSLEAGKGIKTQMLELKKTHNVSSHMKSQDETDILQLSRTSSPRTSDYESAQSSRSLSAQSIRSLSSQSSRSLSSNIVEKVEQEVLNFKMKNAEMLLETTKDVQSELANIIEARIQAGKSTQDTVKLSKGVETISVAAQLVINHLSSPSSPSSTRSTSSTSSTRSKKLSSSKSQNSKEAIQNAIELVEAIEITDQTALKSALQSSSSQKLPVKMDIDQDKKAKFEKLFVKHRGMQPNGLMSTVSWITSLGQPPTFSSNEEYDIQIRDLSFKIKTLENLKKAQDDAIFKQIADTTTLNKKSEELWELCAKASKLKGQWCTHYSYICTTLEEYEVAIQEKKEEIISLEETEKKRIEEAEKKRIEERRQYEEGLEQDAKRYQDWLKREAQKPQKPAYAMQHDEDYEYQSKHADMQVARDFLRVRYVVEQEVEVEAPKPLIKPKTKAELKAEEKLIESREEFEILYKKIHGWCFYIPQFETALEYNKQIRLLDQQAAAEAKEAARRSRAAADANAIQNRKVLEEHAASDNLQKKLAPLKAKHDALYAELHKDHMLRWWSVNYTSESEYRTAIAELEREINAAEKEEKAREKEQAREARETAAQYKKDLTLQTKLAPLKAEHDALYAEVHKSNQGLFSGLIRKAVEYTSQQEYKDAISVLKHQKTVQAAEAREREAREAAVQKVAAQERKTREAHEAAAQKVAAQERKTREREAAAREAQERKTREREAAAREAQERKTQEAAAREAAAQQAENSRLQTKLAPLKAKHDALYTQLQKPGLFSFLRGLPEYKTEEEYEYAIANLQAQAAAQEPPPPPQRERQTTTRKQRSSPPNQKTSTGFVDRMRSERVANEEQQGERRFQTRAILDNCRAITNNGLQCSRHAIYPESNPRYCKLHETAEKRKNGELRGGKTKKNKKIKNKTKKYSVEHNQ